MTERQTLLEINKLSVSYNSGPEKIEAVDNISLDLKKGENLGLIGESGCGKSSLALAIMGLIKEGRVEGEIRYKKRDLQTMSEKKLNKYRWQEIAIVFQNSLDALNPVLTIREQIAETLITHTDLSRVKRDEKITKLMEMVALSPEWQNSYPHQLSGGMRQRVLIAMALACNPELLIIDEPTASLDRESREKIIGLLRELQKKHEFTMLVISHNMQTIRQLTSRLITMYRGRFVEIGITEEVIKHPAHCYTRGLLNSSPRLFPYKDLWGIKDAVEEYSGRGCAFYPRCPQHTERCRQNKPRLRYVGVERMVACNKGGIEKFLEARNISKKFKLENGDDLMAVREVDIMINSGEVVALVGKSGSGKSTLAHTLVGVLQADRGQIKFKGEEVKSNRVTKMIGGMQIVFQDPFSATSDRLSVLEVVKEPLDIISWKDNKKREEKAISLLQKIQLPVRSSFLQRSCRNLSGGQRQRVAIARALITEPSLLIADEITSMLDPSVQASILRKLKGLQNEEGFSMLYITHNLHLARKVADRAYVMEEGQIINKGIPSEAFIDFGNEKEKALIPIHRL